MKIDTNTILIAGAAAVGLYLLTRPRTTALPYPGYSPYAQPGYGQQPAYGQPVYGQGVAPGNTTAAIITAGGSALEGLGDLVGHFFD